MLKRHEIEILLKVGHSKAEVARLAGVSLCSVKRIAEEVPVVHVDDAAEREKRRIGRPSIVEDFRKSVVKILEEKPDLPSLEILRRAREAGYQGGKTALYALVASVRPKEIKPLIRFEGLPGEFSQHDFGEVDVTFLDGSIHRIHFFASRLKYSRFICVSVVKDQAVESLVRNLAEHLDRWGGAPLMCVFDRPKTVALKWQRNGEVTEWNPVFAYVMLELGVGVELCWPHSPQQKGAVENLVGFVKSSFFKVRRFHDQEDLAQQLIEWHREVNQERACRQAYRRSRGVPLTSRRRRPRLRGDDGEGCRLPPCNSCEHIGSHCRADPSLIGESCIWTGRDHGPHHRVRRHLARVAPGRSNRPRNRDHRQEDHRARPARRARSRSFTRTRDSISVAIGVVVGGSAGAREFQRLRRGGAKRTSVRDRSVRSSSKAMR